MINQDVCAYHDEQVLVPFGGTSQPQTHGGEIDDRCCI
jgi:hypothetical protein